MDHLHSTTKSPVKGSHLSFEERVIIQTRLKDGWSANRISVELHRSPNTIRNEIKRGTAALYNGTVFRYKAETGQQTYEQNRTGCCRHYALLEKESFIRYVETHFFGDGWSLDVCVANAAKGNEFHKEDIVCTKTLYNYVDSGLLEIKSIDLPEKLTRKPKKAKIRKNKRVLGRSIEDRPAAINTREEFGHWEVDLVLGSKSRSDSAILALLERKTRQYFMIRVPGRNPDGVMAAILNLKEQYKEHWNDIFKTMTTDNGSEFSKLSALEQLSKTLVYFAHPYAPHEKGSVERHNRLIRRFIKKGVPINHYSDERILQVQHWCNSLPRKMLGYRTPDELFEEELTRIYGEAA